MAKNKKNQSANTNAFQDNQTQANNQYYVFDPNYGFVPASQNGNEMNTTDVYNQQYQQNAPYGQNYQQGYGQYNQGYTRGYARNYGSYGNPMQMQHTMQMNAMQEEINQLRASLNGNAANQKNAQTSITPEKMQEIYTIVDEIAKGQAGPEKLLPLMQNTSMDFWKGLAIGAGAILVYNCTPLKDIINNILGLGLASFMPNKTTDEGFDDDGFDDDIDSEVKSSEEKA